MFNIGAGEMVLILVAALLILGPQRLPELARAIGKFMREFRRQTDEVRNVVEREFYTMDQDFQREPPPRPNYPPVTPYVPPAAPVLPPQQALQALPAPQQHVPLPDLGNTPVGNTLVAPRELEPAAALDPSLARTQALEPVSPYPEPPPASPAEASADPEGPQRLAPLPGTVARSAPKQS